MATSALHPDGLPNFHHVRGRYPCPGYEVANWYALLGPKGLPRPVVDRLNAAMRSTLQHAEVVQLLAKHGVEPRPSSPEELARFIHEETTKWAPIVRASGATVD